jgi:hypothetical protein
VNPSPDGSISARTKHRLHPHVLQEMLLREDSYNNHFANGGVGKQVLAVERALSSGDEVSTWMLKRNSSLHRVDSTRPGGLRASRIE